MNTFYRKCPGNNISYYFFSLCDTHNRQCVWSASSYLIITFHTVLCTLNEHIVPQMNKKSRFLTREKLRTNEIGQKELQKIKTSIYSLFLLFLVGIENSDFFEIFLQFLVLVPKDISKMFSIWLKVTSHLLEYGKILFETFLSEFSCLIKDISGVFFLFLWGTWRFDNLMEKKAKEMNYTHILVSFLKQS